MIDFSTYQSPFAWRYGSDAMRRLWSEESKRRLWRRVWVALADAQAELGLVTKAQADDLRAHQEQVDIVRAHAIESEIHHDLMAEVRTFAEQCAQGGGIIHLGATSADIEDNADVLRVRAALDLIIEQTRGVLEALAAQIERYAELRTMAFTHIQPAEPTTVGYRLAQYAQDVLTDFEELRRVRQNLRGKGFKGAVGTGASYRELQKPAGTRPPAASTAVLEAGRPVGSGDNPASPETLGSGDSPASPAGPKTAGPSGEHLPVEFEALVMDRLELAAFPATTQVYPRKQDWLVLNALAGLAQSLYKFAFDLRILQTPPIGECSEPFHEQQVGSSAMPFKRNPINAEKINSLARYLAALPRVAWDNAAHTLLERTLDDSANRRLILPDAFLAADELLSTTQRIVNGLRINEPAIARNFQTYGVFAATERLLMALARRGADRQAMHELIRAHAMAAWAEVAQGRANPLAERLWSDPVVLGYLKPEETSALLDATDYTGDAPARARQMARAARAAIAV